MNGNLRKINFAEGATSPSSNNKQQAVAAWRGVLAMKLKNASAKDPENAENAEKKRREDAEAAAVLL